MPGETTTHYEFEARNALEWTGLIEGAGGSFQSTAVEGRKSYDGFQVWRIQAKPEEAELVSRYLLFFEPLPVGV